MKTKIVSSLFFISIFFACKKEDLTEKEPNPPPVDEYVHNLNKTSLLKLVNDVRQQGCTCGTATMPPVASITWNDQLGNAAFLHSTDMYSNNYFSHTGLNGSNPGNRITAQGYTWRTYGENIARGYTSEQSVMAGWLGSEGHCRNIMNAAFREMGACREGNYWTQLFGAR